VTISRLLDSDVSVTPKISELKSTDSVTVCLCFQDEFVNVEIENTQLVKDLARQAEEKFAIPLKNAGLSRYGQVLDVTYTISQVDFEDFDTISVTRETVESLNISLCYQDELLNVKIEGNQFVKDLARKVQEKFEIPCKHVRLSRYGQVLNATETILQAGLEDFDVVTAEPETWTLRLQFEGKSKDFVFAKHELVEMLALKA